MFIKLKELTKKYDFTPKRILHVGAHKAEELDSYLDCGAEKIFWVEGNENLCKILRKKLKPQINNVIEGLVSDQVDQEVVFNIANNTQCSSILDLGLHKNLFPSVNFTSKQVKKTTTLDNIFDKYLVGMKIDLLNIDIQGAELKALQGLKKNIHKVKTLYLEVNSDHMYKDCALINELDSFLSGFGFKRVETQMYSNHPWGDAFYIR